MDDKVYTLKYYYNEYNQIGGYTVAIFKDKPTFKMLKDWFEDKDFFDVGDQEYIHYAKDLRSKDKTLAACIGMLSREETVYECGKHEGGDVWRIEKEYLL